MAPPTEQHTAAPGPVGFLGLGPMGLPMARALVAAGLDVTVWNRTIARADPLRGSATVADTPAAAARPVTLTMLPDLPQVMDLVDRADGLRAGWAAQALDRPVLVVMGTVSPVAVAQYADRLASEGITVVDAPVSGGPVGAAERRLSIMVGASPADHDRLLPVLGAMGTPHHLGPVGSGALAKACNQIVVAGTLASLAEAVRLAAQSGLDVAQVLQVLGGGLADSEVLRQKGGRWVDGDYEGGGSSLNQVKDLRFCLEAAQRHGVALPVTEVTLRLYTALVEQGDSALDHSAVIRALP